MTRHNSLGCFVVFVLALAATAAVTEDKPVQATSSPPFQILFPPPDKPAEPALKLLLKDTPKPAYETPAPKTVSGRVVIDKNGNDRADPDEAGVAGVSVSDGYSVVKTGADGRYTIEPNVSAVFINVTRPSGYDVEGSWYKPLASGVDFAVNRVAKSEKEFTFVHVTDTHISTDPTSLQGLSRFVQEVNALTPAPRFVVNSGDLVNLDKAITASIDGGHAFFRNYAGIMNHLSMPYYNVAGDHTDSKYRLKQFPRGDHRCGKAMFWEYLGPNFFSFEYGKIHFASIDYVYHLGKRQIMVKGQNLEYPTSKVQPAQVEWMKQDMTNRTPGTFVVTTSETDLSNSNKCPGFIEMAKQYDVRLQLTGDDHIVAYKSRLVPYRTGGALSGCWWNPKTKQLCPDLSPQGYLVYHVSGEKLEYFYKGLGQRVAIVSHRVGAPWKGRVAVQAHIVQPKANETLQYTLNGKDWKAMREIARPFYRALYEITVDSMTLPDGFLDFRVRSSVDGEMERRVFVVANGTAPVAFQADASLAFTTRRRVQVNPKTPAGKTDVLFNDKVVGVLAPNTHKEQFHIPAASLKKVNTLSFRFVGPGDGMIISSPVLTFQDKPFIDPRDAAITEVRNGHWGTKSAKWGGFIVGDGQLDEGPFLHRQDVFCFVLNDADTEKSTKEH